MRTTISNLFGGWQRFWFTPRSTAPLAVLRIAFGGLTVLWFLTLIPVLRPFFGPDSALAQPRLIPGAWTLLGWIGGHTALVVLFWAVCLAGAVALTVGFHSRLAAVVVFVGLGSFTREMPMALTGGDQLMRLIAFYLVLAPVGAALSVDRWRTDPERFWSSPTHAPWVTRLLQIQVSIIYLSTVWEKVGSSSWRDGTALSYALRLADLQRVPTPTFITDTLWLTQLLTFGALALEVSLAILVWNRTARPWVLGLGVVLHLSIDLTISVGFFSFAVLTLYLAFLSPRTAERLVARVRGRVAPPRTPGTRRGVELAGSDGAASVPASRRPEPGAQARSEPVAAAVPGLGAARDDAGREATATSS